MPASFEDFGIRFLYPENWNLVSRGAEEVEEGVMLEPPAGGFVSIERAASEASDSELIEQVVAALSAEYSDVERDAVKLTGALPGEQTFDLSFYYLDLLIVSRIVLMHTRDQRLLIQIQAESRAFDANEPVYNAILQQLRGPESPRAD